MPEGSVSELEKMPNYRALRITLKLEAPRPVDLHNGEVLKDLGKHAMLDTVPAPHLVEMLKPELQSPNVDFKATTEALGGHFVSVAMSFFELSKQKIVTSTHVLTILQSLKPDVVGVFSNPVLENDRLYVFRVTDLQSPSDADYVAHRDEWLNRRADDPSLTVLNTWLQNHVPSMVSFDISPIQTKYGILQPNGTIR